MKRRILVDGYNLIHSIPSCKQKISHDLEGVRLDLIGRLSSLAARKGWDVEVVFDGGPNPPDHPIGRAGIKVRFSRLPEKADHVIKREIAKRQTNEDLVVVSSDAEIAGYARLHGVIVLSSHDFAVGLDPGMQAETSDRADPPMDKDALKEWLALFSKRQGPDI
jgi:predicted RNA-binding protein with PIN domain